MNQKAFAIFIGAIMIFSAFAGFVMRTGNPGDAGEDNRSIETANLDEFKVPGRLLEWSFTGLQDVIELCPEDTQFAYWLDLDRSVNLTQAAMSSLPPGYGLFYKDQLYQKKISRLAYAAFNNSYAEFHWVRPFPVEMGLVVPYQDFMLIPHISDLFMVAGRPILFGPKEPIQAVIDVYSGGLSTDKITLPMDEYGDLQVACAGKKVLSDQTFTPLGGDYREYYMAVTMASVSSYRVAVKVLEPSEGAAKRMQELSSSLGLALTKDGDITSLSGSIGPERLSNGIGALLGP